MKVKIVAIALTVMIIITGISICLYLKRNETSQYDTYTSEEFEYLKNLILDNTYNNSSHTLIFENNSGIKYTMEWKLSDNKAIARFTGANKIPNYANANLYFDFDNSVVYDIQDNYAIVVDYETADTETYTKLVNWYLNNTAIHASLSSTDIQIGVISENEIHVELTSNRSELEEGTYTKTDEGWQITIDADKEYVYKHSYDIKTYDNGDIESIQHIVERSKIGEENFEHCYTETNYVQYGLTEDFNIEDALLDKDLIDYRDVIDYDIYQYLSR